MGRAIWLTKDDKPEVREVNDNYSPGTDEVLINVEYSGVNSADTAHGRPGFNDYISGYDFSGTVIKAGCGKFSDLKPGTRVCGFNAPELENENVYGSHQDHVIGKESVYVLPDHLSSQEAASLPVVTHAAADALLNQLGLTWPGPGTSTKSVPILIWGGASALGCASIQLAKHMGCYPIVTTAITQHHDALRKLGATVCIDNRDENVVNQVKRALERLGAGPLKHVLDCIVAQTSPSSTTLCEQCCESYGEPARFTAPAPISEPTQYQSLWQCIFTHSDDIGSFSIRKGLEYMDKPRSNWHVNTAKATRWAIKNYGKCYHVPDVVVLNGGDEAIKKMSDCLEDESKLQEFVIHHPI